MAEPRVLALQDIKEGEPQYLELRRDDPICVICNLNDEDSSYLSFVYPWGEMTWPKCSYNLFWRCWSAKPTDAQRKAVKWG